MELIAQIETIEFVEFLLDLALYASLSAEDRTRLVLLAAELIKSLPIS